ncbi:MAG TPA: TonB family protein [Vicinamibacterales bacterium]|nr:TonB family protein [Vicinamibacterales bacterium]
MREAVSDIIAERTQATDGVNRMVVVSLLAHGVFLSALVLMPGFLTGAATPEAEPMMISLGGAEGPEAGGMNPLSARPVQAVAPPEVRPRVEPQPAPAPPEMTVPEPLATPAPKTPAKPVEKPAEKVPPRKPTTGAEVKVGSAVAETGSTAQVPFGGLSTSGGGTGGARVDAPNFCCPSYLSTVVQMIKRNWSQNQGTVGRNTLKFVVQKDGRLTDIEVEQSAGQLLDVSSRRALVITSAVPALPKEFDGETLTIHLIFEYTR